MLRSMTGFGKILKMFDKFDITVEIKSVNSKYFDPSFRLPKILSSMEIEIRNILQEKLIRGKIECRIEVTSKIALNKPIFNDELFNDYKNIIEKIRMRANITEEAKIEHFLRMPDIIQFVSNEDSQEDLEQNVKQTVSKCALLVDKMRLEEGSALFNDLKNRIDNLRVILKVINTERVGVFEYWVERLKKRMADMEISTGYEERIIQEAVIYGEKSDITEEITRLECHLEQFDKIMTTECLTGKKLDFLSQEINREFNTIASKSTKSSIIGAVVEAKTEIDRIREQVQNLV